MVDYLIGVDGGGSGTRALVQSSAGPFVGSGEAGPSALGQGIAKAWRNIELAIRSAFDQGSLALPPWNRCALAAGLSGVTHAPLRDAFLAADPGFARLDAETDSFTMLIGAHGGKPGVILIAGTGSIAEALHADGSRATVGGWGFPVGDEGSGAWLGLQAVRHGQAAMDGRANPSPLARRVWMHCGDERQALQAWCAAAGQFEFAQLARAVFDTEAQDPHAAMLLQRAVEAIEDLALAVDPRGRLPLAASGSIAERLAPRMRPAWRGRLVPPKENAVAGALTLIRQAQAREPEEAV
ncbi:ATPase [Ramlibacter sp. G-1-2-2]|uniref:ATPase n=1 Tax=Ramlibacter agri TaxID=2728837 RepID=A0A848H9Z8_9BURK|nr:BadF/BadG/BcrA/BcrD ATPase family protein [Ramlibacter agri]NML46271.1 ATPase [Ramlibacter agri]